ncbi:hypothetical protein ACS0TY_015932 [Phlomoides rotata]
MGISFLPPFLRTLCCTSPWNYAVFWKLKHQEESVLAWEDGFCDILKQRDVIGSPIEDLYLDNSNNIVSSNLMSSMCNGTPTHYLLGLAVAEMSNASHAVGKGVVGEAALTGNARWIQSDSISSDVLSSILVSEYPDEWLLQFAAGIKTILLLPVLPDGVLQLGSVEMVAEDASFIAYVKNKFDSCKATDVRDRRYVIEQFSLMPAFMNNLEETSSGTTEQVIDNQSSISAVTVKDCYFNANQMVPVFMFQDVRNTSVSPITDTLENMPESEFSGQPMDSIHVAEPCQSSSVDYETGILRYYHDEKLRASSNSNEFDNRMYDDFMNELTDFHFEEGVTEPTYVGNDFDNAIENRSNLFSFPADYELQHTNSFGTSVPRQDVLSFFIRDREPSNTMDVPLIFPMKEVAVEHLSASTVANAHRNFDDNSSEKSNVTSVNISSGKSFAFSKTRGLGLDTESKFSASVSSVESKIHSLSEKQRRRKRYDTLNRGRLSRLSSTNKKRVHTDTGDNQKPRPRDRQLIQDRIKELRKLVPNSEKCSIDGLLDKTIKHMQFLRSVTHQADKLRHPSLKEEADKKTTKPAEVNSSHKNGTSWAVELGSEQQMCPIIVKDLDHPGHMLIEMLCTDHDRFLEIADVIHRLRLTIIKGVMEDNADDSWARFIVETSGSFHRLDIFWPLMQLLQQTRTPISA